MTALSMNWTNLKQLLFASDAAWLPSAALSQLAMWLSWTLVLGALAVWLTRAQHARSRWSLAALVMAWTMLGAAWWPMYSPVYWLGLAFQSPSLTSVLVCLAYLVMRWRQRNKPPRQRQLDALGADAGSGGGVDAWLALAGVGMALGWVLLFDMLAWWPVSLYAWGFGPMALVCSCALAVLWWLVLGVRPGGAASAAGLAWVLLLFVVTRLPSGNLWDALLDPWLWLALQVWLVRWFFRRLRR